VMNSSATERTRNSGVDGSTFMSAIDVSACGWDTASFTARRPGKVVGLHVVGAVNAAQGREWPSPQGPRRGKRTAAERDRSDRADPLRHQAGAERAKIAGRPIEQRVDGKHPAAHLVGGGHLDEGLADDGAHHVADADYDQGC